MGFAARASGLIDLARRAKFRLDQHLTVRAFQPAWIASDVAYAMSIGGLRLAQWAALGRPGARVLEIGPGINLGPQLILAGAGAAVAVADRFLTGWNRFYHPRFYRALRQVWPGEVGMIDRVLAAGGYPPEVVRCVDRPAEELDSVGTEPFDMVVSTAVLEHVHDVDAACRALARVTRPGGRHHHQIDFRDHKNFSRPLEFLLFDEESYLRVWRDGRRGNRVRLSQCLAAFGSAGFEVEHVEINAQPTEAYLDDFSARLATSRSPFREIAPADLESLGAAVTLRRL
jgi:hypothetical protein